MFTVIQMLAHENKTHTTNVSVLIKKGYTLPKI